MKEFKNIIPFPHILSVKDNVMRVVTDQNLADDKFLQERLQYIRNSDGAATGAVYNTWKVSKIHEVRPAKGDWSGYPSHPTYYEISAVYAGKKTVNEL